MTAPRRILPGRVAMITRRCTQRQFLLRPDKETNAIFEYCLAEAAKRFDIRLIAWVAMSNHYHAIVHDAQGRLPAFLEHFHKMLAKVFNVRWRRRENLWASEETCITYLPTAHDVFRKVAYVLSNPFANDVVDRVSDWPGSSSFDHLDGRSVKRFRPKLFFREHGQMPTASELGIEVPDFVLDGDSMANWSERVRAAVAENERRSRAARISKGRSVFGRRAVLSSSPFDSPTTYEPRRTLRPVLAAQERHVRMEEMGKIVEFRVAYREARRLFARGQLDVLFPVGTYRMRLLGVRCAPPPVPLAA